MDLKVSNLLNLIKSSGVKIDTYICLLYLVASGLAVSAFGKKSLQSYWQNSRTANGAQYLPDFMLENYKAILLITKMCQKKSNPSIPSEQRES